LVELRPALPSCAFSLAPLELDREFVQETGQASTDKLLSSETGGLALAGIRRALEQAARAHS
jgi:hypothetical protein